MSKLKSKVASKRIPVLVDAAVYENFKAMAEVTGTPVARVINNAMSDWFDSVGEVRMDALKAAVATGTAILRVPGEVPVAVTKEPMSKAALDKSIRIHNAQVAALSEDDWN